MIHLPRIGQNLRRISSAVKPVFEIFGRCLCGFEVTNGVGVDNPTPRYLRVHVGSLARLGGQGKHAASVTVQFDAIAGILDLTGHPGQSVNKSEDRKRTVLLGDFGRLLGHATTNTVSEQFGHGLVGVCAESLMHCLT